MQEIESTLKKIGAKNGLEIALDENGACTLELADGRVMLLQERADLNELDFVVTLGPVPEDVRAPVFTELLAANFYWQETFGATFSWNADLEEVVLIYPLPLADATAESVETVFGQFIDLQAAWAARLAEKIAAAFSGGAEVDRALSWVHVDERIKGRYEMNNGIARINLHHIVFAARSREVELTIDNAAASPGEELGVNYLSLNPYFAR